MSLMTPYKKRGVLDKLGIGQEDESTPDPDGVPWEVEESGPKERGDSKQDDDADNEHESDNEPIPDFDPDDWIEPPEGWAASRGGGGCPEVGEESQEPEVGEESQEGGDGGRETLSGEQAYVLLQHSTRLQSLEQAKKIVKGFGGSLGDSLSVTMDHVMHTEMKRYRQRVSGCSAVVEKELRESLEAEEELYRKQRVALQQAMEMTKEKKRVKEELDGVKEELKRARKANLEAEKVVELREVWKTYTPEMLGKGKKYGGGAEYVKRRMQVLNRLRQNAALSLEQQNDWEYFTTSWDKEMAEALEGDWPQLFAEIVQQILDDLMAGNRIALSEFMHRETERILDHAVLRVPGVP